MHIAANRSEFEYVAGDRSLERLAKCAKTQRSVYGWFGCIYFVILEQRPMLA